MPTVLKKAARIEDLQSKKRVRLSVEKEFEKASLIAVTDHMLTSTKPEKILAKGIVVRKQYEPVKQSTEYQGADEEDEIRSARDE